MEVGHRSDQKEDDWRSNYLARQRFSLILLLVLNFELTSGGASMDKFNVIWNKPSTDSSGSMPLGNGDVGMNVWVEDGGDLLFYISKTDAWSETGELLKLGRIRVKLSPNPFNQGLPFEQVLKLREGEIAIRAGDKNASVDLRLWVDANHSVIYVEAASQQKFGIQANLELWRDNDILLPLSLSQTGVHLRERQTRNNRVTWYHRNETSNFTSRLKAHSLEGLEKSYPDPLFQRTFGGVMRSKNMMVKPENHNGLTSVTEGNHFEFQIHLLTAQTVSAEAWLKQIETKMTEIEALDLETIRQAHQRWWLDFWNQSWIFVTGDEDTEIITRGYILQRFINACGGRGQYPVKFNGSIFTVDHDEGDRNPDYRRWGPDYWHQNTRLSYWPMLASGDFALIQPFFNMYIDSAPLQRERTKRYFGHAGAYYPETMSFWGLSRDGDYGLGDSRKDKPISWHQNQYIRWEWQGGIEVLAMMLDYYAYTQENEFLTTILLPFANEIITFYDEHYKRDNQGKILIHPAQALETWWDCTNPMPEIAGLKFTLNKLVALPDNLINESQSSKWRRILRELPDIPTIKEANGQMMLAPAEKFADKSNCENPELYAVFPYRIYGVGKPEALEVALLALEKRLDKGHHGWRQDDTFMAFLGLAKGAQEYLTKRAATTDKNQRFPAFWGPNYDWTPDQTHGGNLMMVLQTMLMQCEDDNILLFPAWPKDWDVSFKLHAPNKTTVEGSLRKGKLEGLRVTPKVREKDVVVMNRQ